MKSELNAMFGLGRWQARSVRKLIPAVLVAGIVAMALTVSGCSVDLVHTESAASEAASDETTEVPETSESPQEPTDSPSASAPTQSSDPDGETDLARRSYYANEVEVTTGCPGGTLTLDRTQVITRLTENCHKVVVDAPFTTLLAEKVDILTVSQNSGMGHFIIREIGSAKVEAPFSYLYWDRGNPKLDVTGFQTVAKPNPVSER
jgi:cytoskeletal protein RodZ